ncbi:MAG: DNA alkylation repair protein, partial [Magnetococcales bacterium]|nr:DNA alkylation repair protein [Magnetococcales bacterium]
LELMQRVQLISGSLRQLLPADYPEALAILLAAMGDDDGSGGVEGYDGFRHLPFLHFVERHGLEHAQLSLDALQHMTRYFSAEFAIRPYLVRYPDMTLARVRSWARDADWRLRRLASEGCRPRLPWGIRLPAFIRDPGPCLEILELLRADPHPVVRRSVANHLNDIAKDHPDRVVATAVRWAEGAGAETLALLRHGLRTLIKQGHAEALRLLGFSGGEGLQVVSFQLQPAEVPWGGTLNVAAQLHCTEAAHLSIDYGIHHLRQNGSHSVKVFKGIRERVAAGETVWFRTSHSFRAISTRRYYPGRHRLEVLINGRVVCGEDFVLQESF